jgi:hypothetical protein
VSAPPIDFTALRIQIESDGVRVARDRIEHHPNGERQITPEHLDLDEDGQVVWRPHREGGLIPMIPHDRYREWLDG